VPREKIHFVTGRLAEHALRQVAEGLATSGDWEYSIEVLNISVAALMTPEWVAPRIHVPGDATRVILPGYCEGDLALVRAVCSVPVERGPRDLRRIPEFLSRDAAPSPYGRYNIEILAEINHCPRLPREEILREARRLVDEGADLIDVGCDPDGPWSGVGDVVRALRDEGHRVSIDSMHPAEIEAAVAAGAELVLSVNAGNRQAALDWGCEVVVTPDAPDGPSAVDEMEETIHLMAAGWVPLRVDPVLSPIGLGFAASLGRYLEVRRRWPDAEIMMGIGNLTELTDADSAAINVLLLGFCQEIGARSVLTTEVIPWARSSVRECDLARRLVYHAVEHGIPPKHLEPRLVLLRDAEIVSRGGQELDRLAEEIRDRNFRIFADEGQVHLVRAGMHLAQGDPFLLFEMLLEAEQDEPPRRRIDPAHAFYLGYEMAKAATALALGKQYEQDESLDWGFLTVKEKSHRLGGGGQ
jgi:dihydropteroate synthase-like protein